MGLGELQPPPPPPPNISNSPFRAKKQVIFGQNYLIFGQAFEKIFETVGAPPPPMKLVPYAYDLIYPMSYSTVYATV